MGHKYIQGEEYLRRYPKLQKWINQCSHCGQKGYKPGLPEHIHPTTAVPHLRWNDIYIRKFFKPLELDEIGLCQVCSLLTKEKDI